jgi:hypothetical protein
MSKDLPLWDNDESDVKLEYRLQAGHVIISLQSVERVLKRIRSVFKLSGPTAVSSKIEPDWLPCEDNITLLSDHDNWHFVIAEFGDITAIFGPHKLFLTNHNWTKVSRKLKVKLASVHQLNLNLFSYTVFNKGKHVCNATRDHTGIHQSKMFPMEFYLNGKLIHRADSEKEQLTEDTLEFLSKDVTIAIHEQRSLRFKTPLTEDEFRQPTEVRHVVFAPNWKAVPGYDARGRSVHSRSGFTSNT